MARAGITYMEIEQAAAALAADGKNPTVDAVRAALGGTGSKSTIAPLLKRWKGAHREQDQAQQAGLPAGLLEAVRHLHAQMQQEADAQVQAAQAAADAEVAECRQQAADAQAASAALAGQRAALESELERETARRTDLEAAQHALQLEYAAAEAQNAGLTQRLHDRQSEIENLNRQLSQSRTQFEHYQTAVAAQRASEREEAQQRSSRLEQELGESRRTLAGLQQALAQRDTQLEQLGAHSARLESELATLRRTHQAAVAQGQQLGQEFAAQSLLCTELRSQLQAATQALNAAGAELAVLQHQAPQLQAGLLTQQNRADTLQQENHLLRQDKARLEGRLEHFSSASGGPGE